MKKTLIALIVIFMISLTACQTSTSTTDQNDTTVVKTDTAVIVHSDTTKIDNK